MPDKLRSMCRRSHFLYISRDFSCEFYPRKRKVRYLCVLCFIIEALLVQIRPIPISRELFVSRRISFRQLRQCCCFPSTTSSSTNSSSECFDRALTIFEARRRVGKKLINNAQCFSDVCSSSKASSVSLRLFYPASHTDKNSTSFHVHVYTTIPLQSIFSPRLQII